MDNFINDVNQVNRYQMKKQEAVQLGNLLLQNFSFKLVVSKG